MNKEKTIFKRCPDKECDTISGFILNQSVIKKNEKYICTNCGKEFKLDKWKKSTDKDYNQQLLDRKEEE